MKNVKKGAVESYLPQIEYYYQGSISPVIKKQKLKELINMRIRWLNYQNPILLRRKDMQIYKQQLASIEQCIRILFSEPFPDRALKLMKEKRKAQQQDYDRHLLELTDEKTLEIINVIQSFKQQ